MDKQHCYYEREGSCTSPDCGNILCPAKYDSSIHQSSCSFYQGPMPVVAVGQLYRHYKGKTYRVYCVSRDGNKESDTLYITYAEMNDIGIDGKPLKLYTRTYKDFFTIVKEGVTRFTLIEGEVTFGD